MSAEEVDLEAETETAIVIEIKSVRGNGTKTVIGTAAVKGATETETVTVTGTEIVMPTELGTETEIVIETGTGIETKKETRRENESARKIAIETGSEIAEIVDATGQHHLVERDVTGAAVVEDREALEINSGKGL